MVVGRVQIEDDLAEGSMFEYGITDQVAMPVSGTKTVATSSSKSSEEPNSDRTKCTIKIQPTGLGGSFHPTCHTDTGF